ncbi:hypothetical protein E3O19_12125 [Cryobacterium algoritolerans]|uniref:Uncharacterized protein n=1 Tax=Cryobacterium algoritolerans TaxID=1259184 RepID=A0A4R8WQX5_9MICO|nr:hypothetical protein [Cryobacterium algoritolerans]TFC13217.1 hypothetical protein E3O19_12125 [Cryobacterium algoritolerans]
MNRTARAHLNLEALAPARLVVSVAIAADQGDADGTGQAEFSGLAGLDLLAGVSSRVGRRLSARVHFSPLRRWF